MRTMVEIYTRKNFDVIFSDNKTLVRTNLQVSLLSPRDWNYTRYISDIRHEVSCGRIKDWNELFRMFKHRETGELVIMMVQVSKERYL